MFNAAREQEFYAAALQNYNFGYGFKDQQSQKL